MSVWFCIPSARPAVEADKALSLWRDKGYRVALWRDPGADVPQCDLLIQDAYPGYAQAVNALALTVLDMDPSCDWIVTGGDDTEPDNDHAPDEIARQCSEHFGGTFGVMQPTGDDWRDGLGRIIERIAGSPWIGRDFARRINRGNGPYWPDYTHNFVDEEIMQVAIKYGAFWQRPDLVHYHRHWTREKKQQPSFLKEAYSSEHWAKFQRLYRNRKAAGFPGSEPLAA
jgi:hypothetical protein